MWIPRAWRKTYYSVRMWDDTIVEIGLTLKQARRKSIEINDGEEAYVSVVYNEKKNREVKPSRFKTRGQKYLFIFFIVFAVGCFLSAIVNPIHVFFGVLCILGAVACLVEEVW